MADINLIAGPGIKITEGSVNGSGLIDTVVSAGLVVMPRTANYALLAPDAEKVISNAGAVGNVIITLPPAVALPASGVPFRIRGRVSAAHTLTFQTSGTDVISQGAGVGAAGGNIFSALPGAQIELINDELGKWVGAPLGPTNWSLS